MYFPLGVVCVCGVCILNWPVTQTHKTKREYEQQQLKNERKKKHTIGLIGQPHDYFIVG